MCWIGYGMCASQHFTLFQQMSCWGLNPVFSMSVPEGYVFPAGAVIIICSAPSWLPCNVSWPSIKCQSILSMDWCQGTCCLCVLHAYLRGTLVCPVQQLASLKCCDWRLTLSIRSTSCLAEPVPRGLQMESSWAMSCHLDRVDLGAGLSARTAECIKCCIVTFKYSFQLWRAFWFIQYCRQFSVPFFYK